MAPMTSPSGQSDVEVTSAPMSHVSRPLETFSDSEVSGSTAALELRMTGDPLAEALATIPQD